MIPLPTRELVGIWKTIWFAIDIGLAASTAYFEKYSKSIPVYYLRGTKEIDIDRISASYILLKILLQVANTLLWLLAIAIGLMLALA